MCGIFGYSGSRNRVKTVLEGLKKLEYRGYDSAGIAGISEGVLKHCKDITLMSFNPKLAIVM